MKLVFHFLIGLPLISFSGWTQDILVGLLRLRKCGRNTTCPELMGKCSIVRELHVYGTAVPVHGRDADKLQHQVAQKTFFIDNLVICKRTFVEIIANENGLRKINV